MSEIQGQCKSKQDENALITFEGEANDQHFLDILHQAEEKLKIIEPQVKVRKKIFNILVEVLQNIYHYFEELNDANVDRSVFLQLFKDKNGYSISSGNQIENEKALSLKLTLDKINALDRDQLVNLYREKLTARSTGNRSGSGLGILDIKRKAGTNVIYQFKILNSRYSYFSLKVRVIA